MQKKRASLHEGPLADLFRSTDASREATGRQGAQAPGGAPPGDDDPGAKAPGGDAATAPPAAPASPADEETMAATETTAAPEPVQTELLAPARPSPVATRPDTAAYLAIIRVVGVGGAGVNAVNRMVEADIRDVEFVAINTDAQQLAGADANVTIEIGSSITSGLGSGADPEIGRRAAEDANDRIRKALRGSDLVFVTAGEGGGTGTGAAPVVARIARELGALTVGIVTTPFRFEGARRREQAERGIRELQMSVDTLVTIPNDRLLQVLDQKTSMIDAFRVADDLLRQGVQGICDLITTPGLINLDFADVRTIMKDAGSALMGIGKAKGTNRAQEAAQAAVTSPLIGHEIHGATGVLLAVSGGQDLSLHDAMEIAEIVRSAADESCNIIFGATVDERLGDEIHVTVIATGFDRGVVSEANLALPPGQPELEPDPMPSTGFGEVDDFELPEFLR
jgi:cell division protein FtsZ